MTALLAAGSLISGVTSIFGGGADSEKLADRASRVAALYSLAQAGSLDAFYYLQAIGQVQPSPKAIAIGGIPSIPAGWTSKSWGDAYDKIVSKARSLTTQLNPQFAAQYGAVNVGGTNPVLLAGPAAPVGNDAPSPGQAPPSGVAKFVDSVPWYGWAALALAVVLLLWLVMR